MRQPLYLRSFLMGRELEFDGAGVAVGSAEKNGPPGPVTLSGVDVVGVAVKGDKFVVRGERVALVGDAEGRLHRLGLYSTTHIFGALVFHEYKAKEEVKVTIHADAKGSFDAAVKAVFANGLEELATSVPGAWRCYAAGYFAHEVPDDEAEKIVEACVAKTSVPDETGEDGFVPAKIVGNVRIQWTRQAAEVGAVAENRVHLVVGPHGVPLRFQVMRAAGAGLEEATMQGLSEAVFAPATKNGRPVAAGFEYGVSFRVEK